jgi:hypothetical protein
MPFNILDILKNNTIKQKAIIINDSIINVDKKLNRTFLDAIRSASSNVANTDCADNIVNNALGSIGNYVEENFKFKNIVKNVGLLGNYSTLDNSIVNFVCFNLNSFFKTITAFMESILKFLLSILRKIDKLKTKVEAAILDFSKELRDCFIRIVLDAKFGVEKIIRTSIDFNGLLELMKQCECVVDLIKDKFTACKDLETPEEVILCLNTQYNLSPQNILDNVNDWTKNTLLDNINFGFNVIDEAIQNLLESVLLPFRALVKQYCRELNKKHNVNFLLGKDPSIRCFFEYTEEYDGAGNKYFGMSVIDMLNSMKKWSVCTDFICSSLHDDIKRKIQDYNEQLRLDFKFWNEEITLDIYFACIASDLDSQKIRPTAIREIYAKNKGKGVFTQIIDFYKDIGKFTVAASEPTNPPTLGQAVTKILDKTDSDENDDLSIVDGSELFKPGMEKLIIQLYTNLGVEIQKDEYYRKILELGDWDFRFKKSDAYIKMKDGLNKKYQQPQEVATKPVIATAVVDISTRAVDSQAYTGALVPPLNYYTIPNDYSERDFSNKPDAVNGEGLANYYRRWFNS